MTFFSRRKTSAALALSPQTAPTFDSQPTADNIILGMGHVTDRAILNTLAESFASSNRTRQYLAEHRAADDAWWATQERKQTEHLEHQDPGYRKELNKQRVLAGLPPL
jgi:hypothetical protein